MKTVLLEIPPVLQEWMDERARLGHDRWDEMWEGVLHMVPPPGGRHQDRNGQLIALLGGLAGPRGLRFAPRWASSARAGRTATGSRTSPSTAQRP